MMRWVEPLSSAQETAWQERVRELSTQLGVSCPRVEFVRSGKIAGASYHPFSDQLKIRVQWIAAAGGDPYSRAATALLSHELGHKVDRRFVAFSIALVSVWGVGFLSAVWFADGVWPPAGAVFAAVAVLTPVFHRREFRADDVAADVAGVSAMVEWFRVAPAGAGPGFFHPSDAARIQRQEFRLGRSIDLAVFEMAIDQRSVGPKRRFQMCWREFVAGTWGVAQHPFERQKRAKTLLLLLILAIYVPLFIAAGVQWSVIGISVGIVLVLVGCPLIFVFAPGYRVESPDGCASLRVVARRSVPGVFEVRSFSRWPMTDASGKSSDALARDVGALADKYGVSLLVLAASERLRDSYIRKFDFHDAPQDLCKMLSWGKTRPFLVRGPKLSVTHAEG